MSTLYLLSGEHQWPFSKGLIIESLVQVGISQEAAIAIARHVERQLKNKKQHAITTDELKTAVTARVKKQLGVQWAEHFNAYTPTFTEIIVSEDERRLPFSRAILTRSLEVARFKPKEAYAIAKEVEHRLRQKGVNEVTRAELSAVTKDVLIATQGVSAKEAYEKRYLSTDFLYVNVGGAVYPFSKGILAQSLILTGIGAAEAHRLSLELETEFREQGLETLDRSAVRMAVVQKLRHELGDEVADRYYTLRVVRKPPKPIVILVGGTSGVGKSFIASALAYRLGISRMVSTDSIREVMRAMISPELVPTLHTSTFEAWQTLLSPETYDTATNPNPEQLLQGFREQVQQVSVGIKAIIQRAIAENTSVVIEGVHVLPGYIASLKVSGAILIPIILSMPSEDKHRQHFEHRAVETVEQRPMNRYLKHFKSIRIMQDYIEHLAKHSSIPVLDATSLERAVEQSTEFIATKVLAELPSGYKRASPKE